MQRANLARDVMLSGFTGTVSGSKPSVNICQTSKAVHRLHGYKGISCVMVPPEQGFNFTMRHLVVVEDSRDAGLSRIECRRVCVQ